MYKLKLLFLGVMLGVFYASVVPVYAIDESVVQNVRARLPGGYSPVGLRFGGVLVEPALRIEHKYDDNIYRRDSGAVSDHITVVKPSVDIRTDWKLHRLKAGVKASLGRYRENNQEDYDDYSCYISGRYDVDYDTFFDFSVRSEYKHQDRGALDDVNGDAPIEYRVDSYALGFTRALGQLRLYVGSGLEDYSYENSVRNSVLIDNGDRNYMSDYYNILFVYGLTDYLDIYAGGEYDRKRYELFTPDYFDSDGREYRFGMRANITGKVKTDAFVGVAERQYDNRGGDQEDVSYGASMLWNVNGLTSVDATFERSLNFVSLADVAGAVRTSASMDVQHALRRNVFLDASAWYQDDVYDERAGATDRDNEMYGAGAGFEYMLNRSVSVGGTYDFIRREYETDGEGYKNHEALLFLSVTY